MSATDLSSLVGGVPSAGQPAVSRGRVSVSPANETSTMTVIVGAYSGHEYVIPSGNWSPRGGTMPPVDAACVVGFDDRGDPWVLQWEGTGSYGGGGGGNVDGGEPDSVYGGTPLIDGNGVTP